MIDIFIFVYYDLIMNIFKETKGNQKMKAKETRIEYRTRINAEFEKYKQEVKEIKGDDNELNESFVIIDADGDVYLDDITSLGELESKLEDILEDLAQQKEQEEYDDDSDYYRDHFESIAENCACRAYEDMRDDWIIEHLFYYGDECENATAKLDVSVEWLID